MTGCNCNDPLSLHHFSSFIVDGQVQNWIISHNHPECRISLGTVSQASTFFANNSITVVSS